MNRALSAPFIYGMTILAIFLAGTPVFAQKNVELRSVVPYPDRLADIWGYVGIHDMEYALVGSTTGFSIVDVSNPDQPDPLFFIPGDTTIWRDIKTWQNYAYVTSDGRGSGLLIVDLSQLPSAITYDYWTGDTLDFRIAHNIWIDEHGVAYLIGGNVAEGGVLFLDLSNPTDPQVIGGYTERYAHDAYVRGDTLYTAEIQAGDFSIVDISDKSDPHVIGRQTTPFQFTHNCWLSDDGQTLYTTDERPNAPIAAFDISDVEDIRELDTYRSHPGDSGVPHNVHVYGDYLVNSHYSDGVTIVDASKPDNLVEVGFYDTSPYLPEDGFAGCWGAYPYLPSGLILATDIFEGLFVLSPNYVRAGYLEGVVRNDSTFVPIGDVTVEIIGEEIRELTSLNGQYKTGIADSGSYDIRFSKTGCNTLIVQDVLIEPGERTTLNAEIYCPPQPDPPVGITEAGTDIPRIQLSPNPFQESTQIHLPTEIWDELVYLYIYGTDGRLMETRSLDNVRVPHDLGRHWSPGYYMAVIQSENHSWRVPLVKTQ